MEHIFSYKRWQIPEKIIILRQNNIKSITMIQIGDKAPEVLGYDENGKEVLLSDFKGKKLVLYFCR